jgi:hypothetical protein
LVLALSVENIQATRAPLWFAGPAMHQSRPEAVAAFDAAIETLAFEHADLDLKPPEHAARLGRREGGVESGGGMGGEVVGDDADALGFWEVEPRNWSINRRSKSSLSASPFGSPAGFAITSVSESA